MEVKFQKEQKESKIEKEIVQPENELKGLLVNYVGEKKTPENDEVTVSLIVETIAEEFPEFLMAVAEENWVRGYQQALSDVTFGESLAKEKEQINESS